jgi:hypothetical protein
LHKPLPHQPLPSTGQLHDGIRPSTHIPHADERQQLYDHYRHLHAHPELSMQEHRTADYLQARLEAPRVENVRCGGTGAVGILRTGDRPVVAFRADSPDIRPMNHSPHFTPALEAALDTRVAAAPAALTQWLNPSRHSA